MNASLWAKQQEIIEAVRNIPEVYVPSCHSSGKCVAESEIITLADGSRRRAADLVGAHFELLTLKDGAVVRIPAFADWNNIEPVYTVITESGRRIVRNAQHPLWAADGVFPAGNRCKITPLGWRHVAELSENQLVAVTEELPAFGDNWMNENEVKLLGYLLGDGGHTADTIIFTQMDGKQLDEFKDCANKVGCTVRKSYSKYGWSVSSNGIYRQKSATSRKKNKYGNPYNPIRELLKHHNLLGKHSRDKRIPEEVFNLPKHQMAVFLSRLYATDGWATMKGAAPQIGFCSISEGMVRDVTELLLRFGITGRVRYRPQVNAWEVEIAAAPDVVRFTDEVGIYGKEEAVAKTRARAFLMTQSRQARKWRYKNAMPGTRWERIKSVRQTGIEQTVAICVPKHHTYLTAFYEHNSFTAAHVALWFLYSHPNSIVVTTAPTGRQVKRILWQEIRRAYANAVAPLGGTILKQELQIDDKWYAFGFSSDEPTNFSGLHAEWVLFIVDEATGIPKEIWEAIDGVLSGSNTRLLAIGNPTDATSEFAARIKRGGEGTTILPISAFDTPNFTEEGITESDVASGKWKAKLDAAGGAKYSYLVSPVWVAKIYDKYGPDSAMYQSRVKAKFPSTGSDALIPLAWIEAAQARWQDFTDKLTEGSVSLDNQEKVLGVDVAEFGGDTTVRTLRIGQYVAWQRVTSQEDTMQTTGRAAADLREDEAIHANVDVVGIGNGVARRLEELFGDRATGVNVGERAQEPDRFVNRKAELFWELRTLFEQGGIMIPPDEELTEELSAIKYKVIDSTGKIRITGKDELRKPESLGRSPDRADSLMLSVAKAPEQQEAFVVVG